MVTIEAVREFALGLPRTYEALVQDRVKFRVGRLVYLAFSRDETLMGFAFPKEEREILIASEPEKFMMPKPRDQRYNWVVVRLNAIDEEEMREIVLEAWRMCVPKKVAEAHIGPDLFSGRLRANRANRSSSMQRPRRHRVATLQQLL